MFTPIPWETMSNIIEYDLRFSNRVKRLRIEVVPGQVRVVAPDGMQVSIIDGFVQSRKFWIEEKLEKFDTVKQQEKIFIYKKNSVFPVLGEQITVPSTLESETEIHEWLDLMFLNFLIESAKKYNQFAASRIRLGCAKTRWGSCSIKGVVMINRKLVHAPAEVVEYVLVHELVHLKHRNHSSKFWNEVKLILGDVKPQKKWLRLQGAYLL